MFGIQPVADGAFQHAQPGAEFFLILQTFLFYRERRRSRDLQQVAQVPGQALQKRIRDAEPVKQDVGVGGLCPGEHRRRDQDLFSRSNVLHPAAGKRFQDVPHRPGAAVAVQRVQNIPRGKAGRHPFAGFLVLTVFFAPLPFRVDAGAKM